MRMSFNEFGRQGLDYILNLKGFPVAAYLGMQQNLKQNISKLLMQLLTSGIDGVQNFVGLFYDIRFQGFVGLLQVPRAAAAGRPQRPHDIEKLGDPAGVGLVGGRHGLDNPRW